MYVYKACFRARITPWDEKLAVALVEMLSLLHAKLWLNYSSTPPYKEKKTDIAKKYIRHSLVIPWPKNT